MFAMPFATSSTTPSAVPARATKARCREAPGLPTTDGRCLLVLTVCGAIIPGFDSIDAAYE